MADELLPLLPGIYNPLLNSIFNYDHLPKSALHKAVRELALHHNEYSILVPPAHILHNEPEDAAQKLVTACYGSDDFVCSHIIKSSMAFSTTSAPVSKIKTVTYNTMNAKQVLFKNGMVICGKGFKQIAQARVLGVDYFSMFRDYFPKGSQVLVIYIDRPLLGLPTPKIEEPMTPQKHKEDIQHHNLVEIARKHPLLSQSMLEELKLLFNHNNRKLDRLRSRERQPLDLIAQDLHLLVERAREIIYGLDSSECERARILLRSLERRYRGLDREVLVHEYVELSLYDTVWKQLCLQFSLATGGSYEYSDTEATVILTPELYETLSCLSFNRFNSGATEPWLVNELHKRLGAAMKVFATLKDTTNHRGKMKVLVDAQLILANGLDGDHGGFKASADVLLPLVTMMIVHSKLPNFEAHLYYVTKLNSQPLEGIEQSVLTQYQLAILSLACVHIEGPSCDLVHCSNENFKFWNAIQTKNLTTLDELLSAVGVQEGKPLPEEHFLKSRNINGESCFNFAVRSKDHAVFSMLLDRTSHWVTLEDVLFSRNTLTDQNLLMIALHEEASEVTHELIDYLFDCATVEEQKAYCNSQDSKGRTVGHYLAHDLTALDRLGHLIDWTVKDLSSHTPLYSLCRCYDHAEYGTMITKAFAFVFGRPELNPVALNEHTDKSGNTLLHVLTKSISDSGILSPEKATIDVNQLNGKSMTPISQYVRYNRLENLLCILKDKRLIFNMEDPNRFYNVLDFYSLFAARSAGESNESFAPIERAVVQEYFALHFPLHNKINIGVLNAKHDASVDDWIINTMLYQENPNALRSKYIRLGSFRHFVKAQSMCNPLSFHPNSSSFWVNLPSGISTIPYYSKFRANRTLEHLTMYLLSFNFLPSTSQEILFRNFTEFCGNETGLLPDLGRKLQKVQEQKRHALGEIRLSQQDIEGIENFLNFTANDLGQFQRQISRLSKNVIVGGVKQAEEALTLRQLAVILQQGEKCEIPNLEHRRLDASYNTLKPYVVWLELCVDELVLSCEKVKEKLQKWRQHYRKIQQLNAELSLFESQAVHHKSHQNGTQEELNGHDPAELSGATPSSPPPLRRNTYSLHEIPVEDIKEKDTTFFFFGKDRKSIYKRLLCDKAEEVKKILELNTVLKLDQETIAAEIALFLNFRSKLLVLGVRNFTRAHLLLLRHRHYELSVARGR